MANPFKVESEPFLNGHPLIIKEAIRLDNKKAIERNPKTEKLQRSDLELLDLIICAWCPQATSKDTLEIAVKISTRVLAERLDTYQVNITRSLKKLICLKYIEQVGRSTYKPNASLIYRAIKRYYESPEYQKWKPTIIDLNDI